MPSYVDSGTDARLAKDAGITYTHDYMRVEFDFIFGGGVPVYTTALSTTGVEVSLRTDGQVAIYFGEANGGSGFFAQFWPSPDPVIGDPVTLIIELDISAGLPGGKAVIITWNGAVVVSGGTAGSGNFGGNYLVLMSDWGGDRHWSTIFSRVYAFYNDAVQLNLSGPASVWNASVWTDRADFTDYGSGSSTSDTVGTADGIATAAAVGQSITQTSGLADGIATAAATAQAVSQTVGSSDGIATALATTAAADSIVSSSGAADGATVVTGIAGAITPTSGDSQGVASAAAASSPIITASGTSEAVAVANADARALTLVKGSSDGVATVIGVTFGADNLRRPPRFAANSLTGGKLVSPSKLDGILYREAS